jgi:hypothetical protein
MCVRVCVCARVRAWIFVCVRACSRRPQTEVAECTVPSEVRTKSTARIVRRLASLCAADRHKRCLSARHRAVKGTYTR